MRRSDLIDIADLERKSSAGSFGIKVADRLSCERAELDQIFASGWRLVVAVLFGFFAQDRNQCPGTCFRLLSFALFVFASFEQRSLLTPIAFKDS